MAVTAKFLADFSSFFTAVQKADVELKGLETGAGRVEKSLNKMVDDFGGRKLIQDATLITEAVNRIGGASMLTEREQRRVNAAVTEAIAKYQALGQAAPKHLHDLADATKQVAQNTEKIPAPTAAAGASFKTLFGAFSAANLATTAISKLTSEVTDLAGKGLQLPAVEAGFERLARGVGQNSTEMLRSLQTATKGMVSEFDLMQGANKALLLGLPVTKESMGDMAAAATALGRAMGMDATKSLDDLITALGRSSPMILDNLGLSVKLGEANEEFARKLGKSVDAMTDAEKKMAFYEAAMEAARQKTAQLGEQTKTLSEIMATVWTSTGNNVTRAAGDFNIGVGRMLSSWDKLREAMQGSGGNLAVAVQAAAAQEKFEQLDRTLKQSVLAHPPKGFFEIPQLKVTIKSLGEFSEIEKDLDAQLKKSTKTLTDQQRELKKLADEDVKRVVDSYNQFAATLTRIRSTVIVGVSDELAKVGAVGVVNMKALTKAWEDYGEGVAHTRTVTVGLGDEFKNLGKVGEDEIRRIKGETEALSDSIKRANAVGVSGFLRAFGQLSQMLRGTVVGDVFGGVDVFAGQIKELNRSFDVLGTAGASTAAKIGASVSAAASVVGVAVAAQAVTKAILDKVDKHAGLEAETFLRASGQLRDMNLQLRLAGVNAQELFSIKNERAFAAAFENAKNQIQQTNVAMELYGLTWRDFSEITQEFVTQTGRDLIEQFDRFMDLGGDAEKVLGGMSKSLSQLVVDAVRTGSKISAGLRPMLEQLIRTKKLSQEAAAALLGIEQETTPAWEDIRQAAERYGIELDRLGSKVEQIRLTDIAATIVRDFELFKQAGADVNAVLVGMQDEVQDLVTRALEMGLELPDSMKPIIKAMIDAGLLTDQFGNKLTDLGQLSFAESLVDKIDELIEAIKDLIDETDRYGDEAVKHFGRARNAAEILGRAIPRGFVASGSGTAVPRPGSSAADGGGETVLETTTYVTLDGEVVGETMARQYFSGV